ncbi:TlpA family protein disulfide reductase [Bosea sp. RAF48]|uniref:TlpA family protein disulfide reductase n=1 Tax=Bosea sp. RAF48 TaxID=3237480 RepID=UPI003F913E8E
MLPWSDEAPPELALGRLDGPAIDLADLRGRPVIVHFFATWCAPCVEELASLDALAERLGTGATILAVDVGEVEARVRNFIRQRPVRFPILLDRDRAAMKRWRVEGLPSSFVLDRDLRPVSLTAEPLDWTSPPVLTALEALVGAEPGAKPDAVKTDDNRGRSTP